MPPGVPLTKESRVATIFSPANNAQKLPGKAAVHGLVDRLVACSHHLRGTQHGNDSDEQSRDGGLKILRPQGECLETGTQRGNARRKQNRSQAAGNSEDGVSDELRRPFQLYCRNSEQRLRSQKPPHDHDARYCGKHHRAQNAGGPTADHFFDHEKHRGDRRVESRCQAGCGAHRGNQPHTIARQTH